MIVTPSELTHLVTDALTASNTSPDNARHVAEVLVAADVDGVSSHGVSRAPYFADQAIVGKVDGFAEPTVRVLSPAALHVDACDGFAGPAIARGLERASEMALRIGIVAVGIGRSHHAGMVGYYVEQLARRGLMGLAFANSPAAMAPWGGAQPVFGTDAIAFAWPRRRHPPVVVDLALSLVARGKVVEMAARREPLPTGWALDAEGHPTNDATAALAGTLLPTGGAKGAALALMVELVAAALTGSNFGFQASSFFESTGTRPRVGQFFLVLAPDVIAGAGFAIHAESLLERACAQPGTRLPGDRRWASRARAAVDGISVSDALYDDLQRRRAHALSTPRV